MRDLRNEIQEQLHLIEEDYPAVRNELWNLFKLMKKPDTVIIRDDAREKELEQEVLALRNNVASLEKLLESKPEPIEEEESDDLVSIELTDDKAIVDSVAFAIIFTIICLLAYGFFHTIGVV